MGKVVSLDFTNVKEGGGAFRKTRQEAGDYKGTITKVATVKKKDDPSKRQWLFTIKAGSGVYPYYCGFEENVLWKIRNLFVAAGIQIPKKKLNVDPERVVGKVIGVTLEDDEYENKKQSAIAAIFPASELEDGDDEDDEGDSDDDEDGDDDEDDTTASDDDDDDDDEEEEPEPEPVKKKKKKKKPTDDELEELDIEDI